MFTDGFTGISYQESEERPFSSDLSTPRGGEQTRSLGVGGLTASKLPVSLNVKLLFPLIKWGKKIKTILCLQYIRG